MKLSIDIVIPSFNGQELLTKHLPQVVQHSPQAGKITVIDDGSTDSTCQFLHSNYPQVICLHHQQNQGFVKSVNLGFQQSKADFIALLNNDVSPQADYLKNSLPHFQNPKVFAVTFNEKHSSWPQVSWQNGKLKFTQGKDKTQPRYSAWASGGSAIFRKNIWDNLKGFNQIYSPGYWEDIDLGWRAWKKGFQIIWEPKAKVVHQHQSSFKKVNQNYLKLIKQRNELLFLWQNITDPGLFKSHLNFLITHSLKHPGYLKIILSALLKLPQLKRLPRPKLTDKQILSLINQAL